MNFPALTQSSGLYTMVSQLTAPGAPATATFTCSVTHGESPPSNRTFPACRKGESGPTVSLFHSSCNPNGDTYTPIQLLCLIRGLPVDHINVTWLIDGQESSSLSSSVSPLKKEGKLSYTQSQLNITQGQWVSDSTFTCRVAYEGHIFEDHARRCSAESEPRGVQVYVSPPSPFDLYVKRAPKLTCLVVDLASEDGMSLRWFRDSGSLAENPTTLSQRHFNGTLGVTSTLPVLTEDWVLGETYRCELEHPDLPKKIVRSITKAQGQRAAPEVYVFLPPEAKDTVDKVTLTCLAQNFFPADISVLWLRDGAPVQAEHQATTQPQRVGGPRPLFFVFSRLEVGRDTWERSTFSCRVVHEMLPEPRTRDVQLTKPSGK